MLIQKGQYDIYHFIKNKIMNKVQNSSAEKWLETGRSVWVKALPNYPNQYEDAFLEGKVAIINNKEVMIDLVDSMTRVKAPIQNCLKLTYGPHDVADMVDLQELNEPELLYNIKRRYINDLIFTYCGPTLVIINPYAYIQKLFNESVLQEYQSMVFTDNLQYKSLPPHVFSLAAFCLWQLFDNQRSQSIVISGQSGAGKTQNTKYCLKFLASLGRNMKELTNETQPNRSSFDGGARSRKTNYQNMRIVVKALQKANNKVFGMEEKILGCNQILEAFGNSKTIRNDNSSRFGKLILLVYGETHIDIKSALIISYLLEKSRIVSVSDGERNYHIFYYFCKGTSPEEKQKYLLKDPINKYYYLNQSTTYDLPNVSDEKRFQEIKHEFAQYLTEEETECVYRILSIVLNSGNILFDKKQNENNEEMAIIKNQEYVKNITELLEVDFQKFKHCFKFKTRKMGVSIINSPLKYSEAVSLRDSFSKNIYEQVFNFLVSKLNQKIEIEKIDFENTQSRSNRKSIGLLDIFGFEVLQFNSLQQFFINFANEKLQQLYVSYIFKEEQNQFLREGLKQFSHEVGFQDNKPIIDLFEEYPLGIFHLVNQSSQLNKPDQNLPDSIIKNHNKNAGIQIPKAKRGMFRVNHSCSPVEYKTEGFTAKNKDAFPNQMLEVIMETKNEILRSIILGKQVPAEKPKASKASSKFLGSKFLSEMNKLTQQLYSCDCHFVRCIKPNSKKSPKLFNSEAVLQSLRYLGVLDSIIIRKLGYIYRRPYKEFFKKFFELEAYIFNYPAAIAGKNEDDFKEQCRKIVEKYAKKELEQKDILFGTKKILVKESALNHLELLVKQKRRQRIQTANRVKIMYKNAVFRTQVKKFNYRIALMKNYLGLFAKDVRQQILNKKVLKIQNVIRKYLWHLRLQKIKEEATKSVTKITAYWKMKKERKRFLETRKKAIKLQANIRTFISMGKFFKQKSCRTLITMIYNNAWNIIEDKKARIIQKNWKGYEVRKTFQQILRLTKARAFFKRAIVKFRYQAFRQMLMMYKRPIMKLQSIVRGRYIRRTYLKVKKSVGIIQKAYRRHLSKRFYLELLWKNYKFKLNGCEDDKIKELMRLGLNIKIEKDKKNIIETHGVVMKLLPADLMAQYAEKFNKQSRDMRINQGLYFGDKNSMQAFLGDLDLISNQYHGNWTKKFADLKQEMNGKAEYPISVHLGQNFTCVITNRERMFTFSSTEPEEGESNFSKIQLKSSPKVISVNQNSGHLITKQNKMYEWGENFHGELFNKSKLHALSYTCNKGINSATDVQAKGENRFYADDEGRVFTKNGLKIEQLMFGNKAQIVCVASSYRFTHFLTSNGQLYSKGTNKNYELGINNRVKFVEEPILNEFFLKQKQMLETVSVGMGHTIVKSKLGYVYSWGDNRFGQSSLEESDHVRQPQQIQVDKQKIKALQAVSGLRASYILLDSFQVIGMGTSTGFTTLKKSNFASIDLLSTSNMNSKNLVPIKLRCSWNRTISALFINCIEQNKCKAGSKPDIILKYCKIIAKQWHEKLIYPPYHQWMDNTLGLSDMRKFKFVGLATKPKPNQSHIMDSDLNELKLLMDLRKTSSLFKVAARQKIEELVMSLNSKPAKQWTRDDHELNNYIKEHCKAALK